MQNFNTYSSVIVTGTLAYDEIMDFPGYFKDYFHPEKLHQINVSFALSKIEKQLGGTGLNIAYNTNFALQNKISVNLLGAIGKDGSKFIQFLKKNKMSTNGVLIDKTRYSATGKVITDKNDNQIWGFYYGACEKAKEIQLNKFADKQSLIIISADYPDAFLNYQKQVIENKLSYIYDPGMSLTWIKDTDLKEGIMHSTYLIGNDYEIAMILKRLNISIQQLIKKGIKIITTLGEKGVRYEFAESPLRSSSFEGQAKVHPPSHKATEGHSKVHKVKSYKVKKIIDPTGAGDAWRGGFIAGLVSQKPIVDCLKLGNVMASFAVESYGTVNHKPSQTQILSRFSTL
ncbi:MAG: PfkB family carbohydrate kinase [bacterium]|nr:PfkB family carbohydrate kinase [bacterium]